MTQSSLAIADRVESVIRDKIVFLAPTPGAGHWNENLTDEPVKFFPVYSYLIVYRPETKPFASGLHPSRSSERRTNSQKPFLTRRIAAPIKRRAAGRSPSFVFHCIPPHWRGEEGRLG
jgi:antitoxin ParD1/3/4/toxin ParE1/3/4